VKCDTDEEKLSYVNAALAPFGFEFDLDQDIVISKNDSWQRDVGYSDLYDYHAPFLGMVMDSEPIYFDYNEKQYRIEFWKGQYGITTGAEIGIYIRDNNSTLPKYFYRCANDEERLTMSFLLTKKCNLFSRCDKSWWLTGFAIGIFSRPCQLKMRIGICFPNCEMKDVFLKSLIQTGYAKGNLDIAENTVCFDYCCPSDYKPNRRHRIVKGIAQFFNMLFCFLFRKLTRPFQRTIDKLDYLRYMAPTLYRWIIRACVPRKKQKRYHK